MEGAWPPGPATWLLSQRALQSCPSIESGMEFEEVERISAKSGDFIARAGAELRLPQMTIATAMVFFPRHFTVQAFTGIDHFTLATAATFLAGKVEDTPKKLKDTVLTMHRLRLRAETGEAEPVWPPPSKSGKPPEETEAYKIVKREVLQMELELMKTLNFDLNVEHAYQYVLQFAKELDAERDLSQVAWNFANDSLRTRLCVQYRAKALAAGAVHLAAKFLKPKYDQLLESKFAPIAADAGTTQADLDEISNQILDLYERGAAASIRPQLGQTAPSPAPAPGGAKEEGGVASAAREERAQQERASRQHQPY